jgi:hypothetical protein
MPEPRFPKRRQLKVEPTDEALLASAERSLATIASAFKAVAEQLDALVVEDEHGRKYLRCAPFGDTWRPGGSTEA